MLDPQLPVARAATPDGVGESDPDEIGGIVARLARRDRASGDQVIERAAIMAEGSRSGAILEWIRTHDWEPEAAAAPAEGRNGGLHGARPARGGTAADARTARRYILRAGS